MCDCVLHSEGFPEYKSTESDTMMERKNARLESFLPERHAKHRHTKSSSHTDTHLQDFKGSIKAWTGTISCYQGRWFETVVFQFSCETGKQTNSDF